MLYSLRITACLAIVLLAMSDAQASGGGKKPAKSSGHGPAKKEPKKSGHAASGHAEKGESPASTYVSDVEKILSLIADREKKHDPRLYMEIDLGEFRVTRPGEQDDEIYIVKFHIFGVLNEQDQLKFGESALGREQRLRDAVLSVVHRCELTELFDPSLDSVKSELVAAINQILENDFIRDIAFSQFALEPS